MTEEKSVFQFLLEPHPSLPHLCTVERTTQSKYGFYLVMRYYIKKSRRKPKFLSYSKQEANLVKGMIEEHSLFLDDECLYVMEGFPLSFISNLRPPESTIILAETDGGELKTPPHSKKERRNILKVLLELKGLQHLSLRALLGLDWSAVRGYEEYEPWLEKAKLMGWSAVDLEKRMKGTEWGNVLTSMKRGSFKEIFEMMDRNGARWLQTTTIKALADVIHYRSLRLMGMDEDRAVKEFDWSWSRAREIEEATRMLSPEDTYALAERIVGMDHIIMRNQELGMSLFFLNSPIRITK